MSILNTPVFARGVSAYGHAIAACMTVRYTHKQSQGYLKKEEVEQFKEDGVVCLRGVFTEWVKIISKGIDKNVWNPSKFSERLYNNDKNSPSYFNDFYNWKTITEFNEFVWKSPAARLAKTLMDSKRVAFYHEHVFTKDPGSYRPTPWHHDQAYYPLNGQQNISFWIPITPVYKQACLRYVKASHKWNKWFIPRKFETNKNYDGNLNDSSEYEDMVDIDANPEKYELLSWDLEPGDCIAFNMRTVHGASESVDDQGRRVLATRWLGDDMILASRPWAVSPPILPGNPKGCNGMSVFDLPEVFPVIL
ncbi:uncharacterized protein LOC5521102 [Nematostella vectensis]|uniref:uncharacterized protein LOC5521102 n=1 Tax=Nematostella vectensis TaxID=45351 RepID=UPI00138FDA16|nr:uncharacterized protein LOC5521102 [Nematostella vectensis]